MARLVNVSEVESNDFLFSKSVINKVGDLPSDLVINPEASQNTLKTTLRQRSSPRRVYQSRFLNHLP